MRTNSANQPSRTALQTMLALLLFLQGYCLQAEPQKLEAAPVPTEVAISRPSESEVQRARESLAAYLNSLPASARKLYETYPDLLAIRPPGKVNTAIIPRLRQHPMLLDQHKANLEVVRAGDVDVLFMGDSITAGWRSRGKPTFDKYFGNWKAANFGIGGDTTEGVLYRLQNGEGQGISPKVVMLMIGTNNMGANTAAEIAEGVGAIVLEMQKDFPTAKILLLGIFQRGEAYGVSEAVARVNEKIAKVNRIISRLHDGERVFYLDINDAFLDAEGVIPQAVMTDGVHLTTRGYELWAEAVKKPLAELLRRGGVRRGGVRP